MIINIYPKSVLVQNKLTWKIAHRYNSTVRHGGSSLRRRHAPARHISHRGVSAEDNGSLRQILTKNKCRRPRGEDRGRQIGRVVPRPAATLGV